MAISDLAKSPMGAYRPGLDGLVDSQGRHGLSTTKEGAHKARFLSHLEGDRLSQGVGVKFVFASEAQINRFLDDCHRVVNIKYACNV